MILPDLKIVLISAVVSASIIISRSLIAVIRETRMCKRYYLSNLLVNRSCGVCIAQCVQLTHQRFPHRPLWRLCHFAGYYARCQTRSN